MASDEPDAPSIAPPADCLVDGRPNWDAISFDVLCPGCDYNLRMRTEANCPECGQVFAWPQVIDAAMRKTQWLFEYHWRQRPFWSWWQTVRRAMNPWRFWQGRSIQDRVRVGPLLCLLVMAQLIPLVLNSGRDALLSAVYFRLATVFPSAGILPAGAGTSTLGFHPAAMMLQASARSLMHPGVMVMHFVQSNVLLLVHLFILRAVLCRYPVRIVQLLRVAAYNATPLCVFTVLLHVPLQASLPWTCVSKSPWLLVSITAMAGIALGILYLAVGLRHYLGVRHAVIVALAGWVLTLAGAIGLRYLFDWLTRLLTVL